MSGSIQMLFCKSTLWSSDPGNGVRKKNSRISSGNSGLSWRIFSRIRPKADRCRLHRDLDFATQTLRLEDEPRLASKLGCNASFNQLGSKAVLLGLDDVWSALLDPLNLQAGYAIFCADRAPLNFDVPVGHRQRAIFRGIRSQLVHGHRQRQHGTGAQDNVLATKDDTIGS